MKGKLDIYNIPDAVMRCISEDRSDAIKDGFTTTRLSGIARKALISYYEAHSRIWVCGVCGTPFHSSVSPVHDECGDICETCAGEGGE